VEKTAPLLWTPFLTLLAVGHHSLWIKDIRDRNAHIYMLYLHVHFGALISWRGVESVYSWVPIYKVPYAMVCRGQVLLL